MGRSLLAVMAGDPDHNGKRPRPVEATDATSSTPAPDASDEMPFGRASAVRVAVVRYGHWALSACSHRPSTAAPARDSKHLDTGTARPAPDSRRSRARRFALSGGLFGRGSASRDRPSIGLALGGGWALIQKGSRRAGRRHAYSRHDVRTSEPPATRRRSADAGAISDEVWGELDGLYAEDAVVEYPFALPTPMRLEGRDAIRRYFAAAATLPLRLQARNMVVHETADPEVVVAQWDYKDWSRRHAARFRCRTSKCPRFATARSSPSPATTTTRHSGPSDGPTARAARRDRRQHPAVTSTTGRFSGPRSGVLGYSRVTYWAGLSGSADGPVGAGWLARVRTRARRIVPERNPARGLRHAACCS